VGAAGEPGFNAPWNNFDAPSASQRAVRFTKDPLGRVMLTGFASAGASGTILFVLPVGYTPVRASQGFAQIASGGGANVVVTSSGAVVPTSATGNVNTWVALDGIIFDTETVTTMSGGMGSPPIVAALPGVGPNSDMDANFCAWQARRRALNGSWDFIGGAAYRLRGTTYTCAAVNTWEVPSTAVMPRWTCPATGVYRFLFGAQVRQLVAGQVEGYMGLSVMPTATALDSLRTNFAQATAGTGIVHVSFETQLNVTAGQVIAASFNTQAAAANVQYVSPWVRVEPTRFS
jgi:hypothetical protein